VTETAYPDERAMKTIYAVLLLSGFYTDGELTSLTPLPLEQSACMLVAQQHEAQLAKCVQIDWTDTGLAASTRWRAAVPR
jgi:hypothetical protein